MSAVLLLSDVRPWGRGRSDVLVADGTVQTILEHEPGRDVPIGGNLLAGAGRILVPSFSDVHLHLDSTRLGLPFRPHTGGKTLPEQIANDRRHWRTAETSVAERATHTLGVGIVNGVTRARSYAQVDTDCRLERLEGVFAAREAHRDRAVVQVIAFPQAGVIRDVGTAGLLDDALREGADVVGGIDPCALDRDPRGQLDVVFGLADQHQVPVDIHLHEPGELGLFSLDLIFERVRALSMQGRVTVSHAFTLGSASERRVVAVLDTFAELDVALTTVAPTPERRLPLAAVAERGIRIGLGQDGQRDYWSPYGNGDMLDRTWQLAWTNGFNGDADIELCLAVATAGGARVMTGQPLRPEPLDRPQSLQPGDPADLVLLHGDTVTAAVMDRLPGRTVLHAGRVVADDGQLR